MDSELRTNIIENYGKAFLNIQTALKNFPVEMWKFKPAPIRWSIHEIIIHFADSEANSYHRCRRFIAEPGSKIFAYDQDKWSDNLDYHSQSAEDALELFRLLRKMTYDLIKDLPEEAWSLTIEHEHLGTITMDTWLEIYEEHITGHIRQMEKVFEEWKNR